MDPLQALFAEYERCRNVFKCSAVCSFFWRQSTDWPGKVNLIRLSREEAGTEQIKWFVQRDNVNAASEDTHVESNENPPMSARAIKQITNIDTHKKKGLSKTVPCVIKRSESESASQMLSIEVLFGSILSHQFSPVAIIFPDLRWKDNPLIQWVERAKKGQKERNKNQQTHIRLLLLHWDLPCIVKKRRDMLCTRFVLGPFQYIIFLSKQKHKCKEHRQGQNKKKRTCMASNSESLWRCAKCNTSWIDSFCLRFKKQAEDDTEGAVNKVERA